MRQEHTLLPELVGYVPSFRALSLFNSPASLARDSSPIAQKLAPKMPVRLVLDVDVDDEVPLQIVLVHCVVLS